MVINETVILLKENVEWIKDLFTIIFTTIGICLVFLTYKKAKATILAPIRTEVIKKQSKLLTDLVNIIKDRQKQHHDLFDYENLVAINAFALLLDYRLVERDENKIREFYKQIRPMIFTPGKNSYENTRLEKVGMFTTKRKSHTKKEIQKYRLSRLKRLKHGEVNLQIIYGDKDCFEFSALLNEYSDNPFLPKKIKNIIQDLKKEASINITTHLKATLKKFIIKCYELYSRGEQPLINPEGIHNEFNEVCNKHASTVQKLKQEISSYLQIDKKW